MDQANVLYDGSDETGLVTITVNRPDKLNALDLSVLDGLERAISRAREDAACRVVILTGAGSKAFVAGADIAELARNDAEAGRAQSRRGQAVFNGIWGLGKPVIAMVNGYALGGGLELALACHLRTMSERARLGLPEVSLGLIPGYGGTQRLARLVGAGRALELVLTGDPIDAETALRMGLVNRTAPPEELGAVTVALAERLLARGPRALERALEAVLRGGDGPLEEGLRLEADLFGSLFDTEDAREGLAAFLEKRKPSFRGA